MNEWKKVDWTYIKYTYSRYIEIEIDGKFYLVDLMPYFTGLLSIPQIHRWQRLPVYQAKNDEPQGAMRKLKLSETMKNNFLRKEAVAFPVIVIAFFYFKDLLKPWFNRFTNKITIPGIHGIVVAILGYLVIFFIVYLLLGSIIRREKRACELAPFRISIRYKQKSSEKLVIFGLVGIALMFLNFIYAGIIAPFGFSILAMFFAGLTKRIPPKTEIWYKIRPRK